MTSRKPQPVPPPSEDALPDHLPRWLEAVSRRLRAELGVQVENSGRFPELRGSDRRILQMIPDGSIRITDLAAVAGMTKQALGEFVDRLELAGFVSSSKDESDGRVRLVSRTELGDSAARGAADAIASVEDRWRQEIGACGYDAMMDGLRKLGRGSLAAPPVEPAHR